MGRSFPLQKSWVTDRAAEGWLALNIEAHDLPIDKPEAFYRQQFDGPLKNYWSIGNDDRDRSYFLRVYLSCYRAVEYLTKRKRSHHPPQNRQSGSSRDAGSLQQTALWCLAARLAARPTRAAGGPQCSRDRSGLRMADGLRPATTCGVGENLRGLRKLKRQALESGIGRGWAP